MSSRPLVIAVGVVAAALPLLAVIQDETLTVQGVWSLNRDLTPAPARRGDDGWRPAGRGDSRAAGLGRGGLTGPRGPSEKELRKLEAVRRRIEDIPQRLIISVDGARVHIVDEIGRTTTLIANGKKQDRLTGDGEFKSTTTLEGGRLVVEEDFGGSRVTTTYQRLAAAPVDRLQVTLQIEGIPEVPNARKGKGGSVPIRRVYDAEQ